MDTNTFVAGIILLAVVSWVGGVVLEWYNLRRQEELIAGLDRMMGRRLRDRSQRTARPRRVAEQSDQVRRA